jgi:hypothetical protein
MLKEEQQAYQAEIDFLTKKIAELACKCPRFGIQVQHMTEYGYQGSGVDLAFGRALSGAGGVPGVVIPIEIHDDGTIEGVAEGAEEGAALLKAPRAPVTATADFASQLMVRAQGKVSAGAGCAANGECDSDKLHLILTGETGDTPGDAHIQVGRTVIAQPLNSPGGGGGEEFDLPGYVGEATAKDVAEGSPVRSIMRVEIVSLNKFAPAVDDPAGTSLLFTVKACQKAASK